MNVPFRYVHRDTFIHRLHPLVKLVHLFLTLILILSPLFDIRYVPVPLVWLALTAVMWAMAGIEVGRFATLIKLLTGTFLFLIILQGFMYRHGTVVLFHLFNLEYGGANLGDFTLEGMLFGLMLCVRILTAAASLPLLVMTTSSVSLMDALRKMRLPKMGTFMIVSALSFTTLIFEMWASITDAQKLRAFDIDRMNLIVKLRRAYVPIITPLVLLLFRKGNDFQIALETRGFGAPGNPTEVIETPIKATDIVSLFIILFVFGICQYLRIRIGSTITGAWHP